MASQDAINKFADYLRSKTDFYVGDILDALRDTKYSDQDVAAMQASWDQNAGSKSEYQQTEALRSQVRSQGVGNQGVSRETPSALQATPTAPVPQPGGTLPANPVQSTAQRGATGNVSAQASGLGVGDPNAYVAAGYDQYTTNFNTAKARARKLGEDVSDMTPMTSQEWIVQTTQGDRRGITDFIITALQSQFQQDTGGNMPAAEEAQIRAKLSSASPETLGQMNTMMKAQQGDVNALLAIGAFGSSITPTDAQAYPLAQAVMNGDDAAAQQLAILQAGANGQTLTDAQLNTKTAQSMKASAAAVIGVIRGAAPGAEQQAVKQLTGLGLIKKVTTAYDAANPDPTLVKAALDKAIFDQTGNHVSDAELGRLAALGAEDQQREIAKLPYRNTGIPVGQYKTAESTMNGYYQKYFGSPASQSEIVWANGKNDQEIQDHVMNSPSKLDPAITVSTFTTMKGALDKYYQADYGHQAPEELLKDFHSVYGAAKAGQ